MSSFSKDSNVMADNVQMHARFTAFLQTPEDSMSCYPATMSSRKFRIRSTQVRNEMLTKEVTNTITSTLMEKSISRFSS